MTVHETKALVRRFFEALEAYCQGDEQALEAIVAPTFVDRVLGTVGIRQTVEPMRATFADFHCSLQDQLVEEDRVVALVTFEFTHAQPFLGIPATGKRVKMLNVVALRLAEGRIAERLWSLGNGVGVLEQLGAFPLTPST